MIFLSCLGELPIEESLCVRFKRI